MLILSTYGILAETSDDSNSDIPKSCIKWYDGCNDCSVVNGKIGSCTEKACLVQNEPKCLEYSNSEIVMFGMMAAMKESLKMAKWLVQQIEPVQNMKKQSAGSIQQKNLRIAS